jgi:hypothetical protein
VRGRRAWLCVCALGGLAAIAASASGEGRARAPAAASCGKLLPPRSGSYLGAFTDFNTPTSYSEDDVTAAKIDAFQRRAGVKLAWVYFSQNWYKGLAFPRRNMLTVWRAGAVPYIAFLPNSGNFYGPGRRQTYPERRFSLQHILAGRFDPALRAWADATRDANIPILMDFGTEVNDGWGTWNAAWNGADRTDGYGDPAYPDGAERFRDTYRHLVTLFREEGATNVTWFFHVDSQRQYDWWNELPLYYPGDAYVDWLGISVYGSLFPSGPILPFAEKLEASWVYTDLTALSRRPAAISEMGVVDDAAHGKAAWIRHAFAALRSGRYPRIRAATWWNMGSPPSDTRIDSSAAALSAFRAAVAGPFFGARPRFAGNCLPATPGGLSAVRGGGGGRVRLSWHPVSNAAHYEIRRDVRLIATTEATSYEDPSAEAGRRYSYSVRAVNPLGRSTPSVADVLRR